MNSGEANCSKHHIWKLRCVMVRNGLGIHSKPAPLHYYWIPDQWCWFFPPSLHRLPSTPLKQTNPYIYSKNSTTPHFESNKILVFSLIIYLFVLSNSCRTRFHLLSKISLILWSSVVPISYALAIGVEVKAGEPVEVNPEDLGKCIHLSQVIIFWLFYLPYCKYIYFFNYRKIPDMSLCRLHLVRQRKIKQVNLWSFIWNLVNRSLF